MMYIDKVKEQTIIIELHYSGLGAQNQPKTATLREDKLLYLNHE